MNGSGEHEPVRVRGSAGGALTYLVGLAPEALPVVRARDLAAAWEVARAAAIGEAWGPPLRFRFQHRDGATTELALTDRDACCWARAIDAHADMSRLYGLALCLRLLALVDLLGRARWAAALVELRRDGAALHPEALRAAASAPLTEQGRFDDIALSERLRPLALATPSPSPGVRA